MPFHTTVQVAIALAATATATDPTQAQSVPGDYHNSNYTSAKVFYASSPPFYPAPAGTGAGYKLGGDWAEAYSNAAVYVSSLNLMQKVNITTGQGWLQGLCIGETGQAGPKYPGLCLMDSPLGIRSTDGNTAFPPLSQAAKTWDVDLINAHGRAMGEEFKGKGVNVQLGPVVGPLGAYVLAGRNWEGYSPDSYLSGIAVAQTIFGIQDAGVQATVKHYIGNEQEHFRQRYETYSDSPQTHKIDASLSSYIDDRTMHETYLWPFADAVRAGVSAVMCSYNQVNNSYACQNSKLLNGLLKDELGFQGYVMTDWAAGHAGVASVLAGLDMMMPGDQTFSDGLSYFGGNLTAAVLNGTIPESRLDDMAIRIVAPFLRLKQDKDFPKIAVHPLLAASRSGVDVRGNHSDVAFEVARDSIVLLKNVKNALPLGLTPSLNLFGEDAIVNPAGANACTNEACLKGTVPLGWGSGIANFPYLISPSEAISARARSEGSTTVAVTDQWDYGAINQTAALSNTALVFISAISGEGYLSVDKNFGDRNNYTAWKEGDRLVEAVSSRCNNTIVIVHSVGPISLESFADNPNVTAIVWAGLPGQESGNSLTSVLYGDVSPSGKLTYTIGRKLEDYGPGVMYEPNADVPQQDLPSMIDYKHFDNEKIQPRFEFGFGLSYATFKIDKCSVEQVSTAKYSSRDSYDAGNPPKLQSTHTTAAQALYPANLTPVPGFIYPYINNTKLAEANGEYPFPYEGEPELPLSPAGGGPGGNPSLWDILYRTTCTVTNTGSRAGAEVVQLYLGFPESKDYPTPPNQLRGFQKLYLQSGKSATAVFDTTRRDLSVWSTTEQNWIVLKDGVYTFNVGNSSRNLVNVGAASPPV